MAEPYDAAADAAAFRAERDARLAAGGPLPLHGLASALYAHAEGKPPTTRAMLIQAADVVSADSDAARVGSATPELLKAVLLALPALRAELQCNLSGHCLSDAQGQPDRATLDDDVREPVEALEAAIAGCEVALARADMPVDLEAAHG